MVAAAGNHCSSGPPDEGGGGDGGDCDPSETDDRIPLLPTPPGSLP